MFQSLLSVLSSVPNVFVTSSLPKVVFRTLKGYAYQAMSRSSGLDVTTPCDSYVYNDRAA